MKTHEELSEEELAQVTGGGWYAPPAISYLLCIQKEDFKDHDCPFVNAGE